jgi:hypothetical protein
MLSTSVLANGDCGVVGWIAPTWGAATAISSANGITRLGRIVGKTHCDVGGVLVPKVSLTEIGILISLSQISTTW